MPTRESLLNSAPQDPLTEHLSIRRAKSVYALPSTKSSLTSTVAKIAPVKEVVEPPVFFVQSVAEELIEAQSPARSRRSSGTTASRRSSYGVTQTRHLIADEILSPKALETAVSNAKDEVRIAKRRLSKYGSIEFAAAEHAHRGQRGIEEACRALLAVEDLYKKEQAFDDISLAWFNRSKTNQ